nr:hypothetical protein [Tanacetum cinerariifolium]
MFFQKCKAPPTSHNGQVLSQREYVYEEYVDVASEHKDIDSLSHCQQEYVHEDTNSLSRKDLGREIGSRRPGKEQQDAPKDTNSLSREDLGRETGSRWTAKRNEQQDEDAANGYDTESEEDHSNYEDEETEDHMNNVGGVADDHSSDSHKYKLDDEVDMSGTYNDTTDNASSDEDTIQESQSPNSGGKYVPVCQKHNPNVKTPIPITGCVLGLANVHTWDDILNKFSVRKVESGAAKEKEKKKV